MFLSHIMTKAKKKKKRYNTEKKKTQRKWGKYKKIIQQKQIQIRE